MISDLEKAELIKNIAPVSFGDGSSVFKKFMDEYLVHKKGFFILAPSGTGKTYFVKNQKEKHWIDGDDLWIATGAHPNRAWWTEGLETIFEVDQKSDIITKQAKKLGLWIIGASNYVKSSNYWLMPDAIVIPDWRTNKRYIIEREKDHYDGGATSKDFGQVIHHRKDLLRYARKNKVPVFKSVKEAADFLASQP